MTTPGYEDGSGWEIVLAQPSGGFGGELSVKGALEGRPGYPLCVGRGITASREIVNATEKFPNLCRDEIE